ncbi:MAG: hypothetical protein AMXMBFR84_41220 [Candidatus Hydrogenedentota bacterium]
MYLRQSGLDGCGERATSLGATGMGKVPDWVRARMELSAQSRCEAYIDFQLSVKKLAFLNPLG